MKPYSRIVGTGSYLPEKVLSNSDLEKIVEIQLGLLVQRLEQRRLSDGDPLHGAGNGRAQRAFALGYFTGCRPQKEGQTDEGTTNTTQHCLHAPAPSRKGDTPVTECAIPVIERTWVEV